MVGRRTKNRPLFNPAAAYVLAPRDKRSLSEMSTWDQELSHRYYFCKSHFDQGIFYVHENSPCFRTPMGGFDNCVNTAQINHHDCSYYFEEMFDSLCCWPSSFSCLPSQKEHVWDQSLGNQGAVPRKQWLWTWPVLLSTPRGWWHSWSSRVWQDPGAVLQSQLTKTEISYITTHLVPLNHCDTGLENSSSSLGLRMALCFR